MTELVTVLTSGIGMGSIYALLALGFVVVYKSTKAVDFALPGQMVLGALATYAFSSVLGLNFFVSLALAALVGALLGVVIERTFIRPMVGKPVFMILVVTIGLDVFLRVIGGRIIGGDIRHVGDPWGYDTITIGGFGIGSRHIAAFVVAALVVTALGFFFRRSRLGLAMRMVALDQETAMLQGVKIGLIFAVSWGITGALAAVAGTFVAVGAGIGQGTWLVALKAVPAMVLGGLDSIQGAIVGGLAVGLVEASVATWQPEVAPWLGSNFSLVAPYVLLIVVLLVRPYGLFGTKEVERV